MGRAEIAFVDGQLVVRGSMRHTASHRHPAVQVTIGGNDLLEVHDDDGHCGRGRLVVVASGIRHTLSSAPESSLLSLYLGPHTPLGAALGSACRAAGVGGVWVPPAAEIVDDAVRVRAAADLQVAARQVMDALACVVDLEGTPPSNPLLVGALTWLASALPQPTRLSEVAAAVGVSPDHLGHLFARQFGVGFSATVRWMRLTRGALHLHDGHSITDAAHMAGFADAAHANRTCWELAGTAPSTFAPPRKGLSRRGM